LITLRNTIANRGRRAGWVTYVDDPEEVDQPTPRPDLVERDLVAQAFAGLPPRWRAVLWQTEVEGHGLASVAEQSGITANAIATVASRARERLRQSYLQAHVGEAAERGCRAVADRLGAWVRGGLSRRG